MLECALIEVRKPLKYVLVQPLGISLSNKNNLIIPVTQMAYYLKANPGLELLGMVQKQRLRYSTYEIVEASEPAEPEDMNKENKSMENKKRGRKKKV